MSLFVGCGGRTPLPGSVSGESAASSVELCNGVDDDGDLRVDEGFRDSSARYVNDQNCGQCGHACSDSLPHARVVGCGLLEQTPACVARNCEPGYAVSSSGRCVALGERACMPCQSDAECGSLPSAHCATLAGERRCTIGCADGCPDGFSCSSDGSSCLPPGDNCSCDPGESFTLACAFRALGPGAGPALDAKSGAHCPGHQVCSAGMLTSCVVDQDVCDGVDNDCDGKVDEDFVDERGAYSRDLGNCGACGVDCRLDGSSSVPLACGGDPFAPTCVVLCPDSLDGVQPGDHLDADGDVSNGCECLVTSLSDPNDDPSTGTLDANCDGADGSVLTSYYVAVDGDDSGPGSPTRPLRSISHAVELAASSLGTASPRADVYVATGTYTETIALRDGVFVHGGYRRDFRARNPDGFEVVVVAPEDTTAFAGAALVADGAGQHDTLVEGLYFRGLDASSPGAPALGVVVQNPGSHLTLRNLHVRAGKPGRGTAGGGGAAGAAPTSDPTSGEAPRAALEDSGHLCIVGATNTTRGGMPGKNLCQDVVVSGGTGGSAECPNGMGIDDPAGMPGRGVSPGAGGVGGTPVSGPISGTTDCPSGFCCGLADFVVPFGYTIAAAGEAGANGSDGSPGAACSDALGTFSSGGDFQSGLAQSGGFGTSGNGGGGGGAGGGVEMTWGMPQCEFRDGLGGGGGGGGAGGCSGAGGGAGVSGGPSIGVLIRVTNVANMPSVQGLLVETEDGGAGGSGGAGGDGAAGGRGGAGGSVPRSLATTPTLAGAAPGQRGGHGGPGGAGGAGGGGCGGSSVGLWVSGLGAQPQLETMLRAQSSFTLGHGGSAGLGGGGAEPAADGLPGKAIDVLLR